MTQPPPSDADAPAALTAFLRGVERRGALFADLHSGDPLLGEQGYAIALRVFRQHALEQPFAHWPRLFWRALLASPQLRGGVPSAHWNEPFAALGRVGSGPRAALLLRLVGGLGDADAASALGVAPQTYRLALRQALPHRTDGNADPDAWRALGEAVQHALRGMPAERLAHLARLRQAAVQGRRPELIGPLLAPSEPTPDVGPHRGLRALLWAGVAACALGLVATFWWPAGWSDAGGDPRIRVRPLAAAQSPAARYDAAFGQLTERDFELLAATAQPASDDPAFHAWYAAELAGMNPAADPAAGMRDPEPAAPLRAPAPDASLETTSAESADAPL